MPQRGMKSRARRTLPGCGIRVSRRSGHDHCVRFPNSNFARGRRLDLDAPKDSCIAASLMRAGSPARVGKAALSISLYAPDLAPALANNCMPSLRGRRMALPYLFGTGHRRRALHPAPSVSQISGGPYGLRRDESLQCLFVADWPRRSFLVRIGGSRSRAIPPAVPSSAKRAGNRGSGLMSCRATTHRAAAKLSRKVVMVGNGPRPRSSAGQGDCAPAAFPRPLRSIRCPDCRRIEGDEVVVLADLPWSGGALIPRRFRCSAGERRGDNPPSEELERAAGNDWRSPALGQERFPSETSAMRSGQPGERRDVGMNQPADGHRLTAARLRDTLRALKPAGAHQRAIAGSRTSAGSTSKKSTCPAMLDCLSCGAPVFQPDGGGWW